MGLAFLRGVILGAAMAIVLSAPTALASGSAPAKDAHGGKDASKEKGGEILLQLSPYLASIDTGRKIELLPITPFFVIKTRDDRGKICDDMYGVRDVFVTYFNEHTLRFVNDAPDLEAVSGPLRDAVRKEIGSNEVEAVRLLQGPLRPGLDFPHATIVGCSMLDKKESEGGEKKPEKKKEKKEKKKEGKPAKH